MKKETSGSSDTKTKLKNKIEKIQEEKTAADQRTQSLSDFSDQLKKIYGNESVEYHSSSQSEEKISSISTGSLKIDIATGIMGVPTGRITEAFGAPGSGKTTLCLSIVAQINKKGKACLWIDTESAFNMNYAITLGVDPKLIVLFRPTSGEKVFAEIDKVITNPKLTKEIGLIVIDSIPTMISEAQYEGATTDKFVGSHARMITTGLFKILGNLGRSGVALVLVNQVRENINFGFTPMGTPNQSTPGGFALKHLMSLRMQIKQKKAFRDADGKSYGHLMEVKFMKNRYSFPVSIETDLYYKRGFNTFADIIDLALEKNVIVKNGSWIAFKDRNIAQGRENAIAYIERYPSVANEMLSRCGIENYVAETDEMPEEEADGESTADESTDGESSNNESTETEYKED